MSATINDWIPSKAYVEDEVVIVTTEAAQFNNFVYRCITGHTSLSFATDWGNGLWERVRYQGIQGVDGPQGVVGPAGADGAIGAAGPAGADGVFTEIASQLEAETGADNTKGMSPLRTSQAITAQTLATVAQVATNTANIATLQTSVTTLQNLTADLDSRVTVLETISPLSRILGEQKILNNTLVAIDIEGADAAPDGAGARFEIHSSGAKSARVHIEIYREDDAEVLFTTCVLLLHLVNDVWYAERENTTIIVGNPDGVVFGITTTEPLAGVFVGQVNYTSSNMVGGNYKDESKVKYSIQELSDTF